MIAYRNGRLVVICDGCHELVEDVHPQEPGPDPVLLGPFFHSAECKAKYRPSRTKHVGPDPALEP